MQRRAQVRWTALAVLLFCFATVLAWSRGTPANTAGGGLAREIDTAEESFTTALTAVDITKLEQLLADDFTWTHSTGGVEMKKEYLGGVRETRRYKALRREGTSFRIYDKAAVSSGIVHITVFTEDQGERVLHLRYSAVYVLQNRGWRLAAWHNTRLAE